MLWLVEWCQGSVSVLSWCQASANLFLFHIVADAIYQMYLSISIFLLTSFEIFVHVYHSSVLGQQSAQSPDLDRGPASLKSFLKSRVVWHVAARSL